MTNIAEHQSASTTKILCLGDSGAGKSGGLASLAEAGYNLRIVDVDNGLDILRDYLTNPISPYKKDAAARVEYETLTDTMRQQGGRLIPVKASVWQRTVNLLDDWKTAGPPAVNFGNISTWSEKDVLVIDSLSFLADHALKFMLSLNMRLGQKPHQSDWGDAQLLISGLLEKLYDESVKCNVVVNCHIKYMEDANGITKCFPESVGKALSPKIGRYFNNVVLFKTSGSTRKIITKSTPQLELKTSSPLKVKDEYPISSGLADLFRDLRAPVAASAPVIPIINQGVK